MQYMDVYMLWSWYESESCNFFVVLIGKFSTRVSTTMKLSPRDWKTLAMGCVFKSCALMEKLFSKKQKNLAWKNQIVHIVSQLWNSSVFFCSLLLHICHPICCWFQTNGNSRSACPRLQGLFPGVTQCLPCILLAFLASAVVSSTVM